jgi:hypothetical protein
MAMIAALMHGIGRCAILLEFAAHRLLRNWMRHQVTRLHASGVPATAQEPTTSGMRKDRQ